MFATCLVRRRTKVVGNTALAIDRWQPNKRLRARSGSPLVDLANDFLVAGALLTVTTFRDPRHIILQILMTFVLHGLQRSGMFGATARWLKADYTVKGGETGSTSS
jgi:hypothetical protein